LRIAFVGLGNIAGHHVAALEEFPDAEVVAGVDPGAGHDLTFRGAPVPHFSTVSELFASGPIDVAIVTTPTSTHAAVVDEIAQSSRCRILVEKPLAANLGDVRRLLDPHFRNDVQTLFHAAAAPEVEWATAAFAQLVARHGEVVGIESFVGDGTFSDVTRLRESLGDAWIDLGINALSVAARFVSLESVSLTYVDHTRESYGAVITFRHDDASGGGSVFVTWAGLEPSKHSLLQFGDGARLLLDHQAGAGVLTSGIDVDALFLLDDAQSRLGQHYRNLFEIVLAGGRLFDRDTELDLHEKLFGAVH
jgi:predicted dehydrogenase